jgi:prepilin-type N-terminal cleavage/methylation domain-containing protein
MNEFEEITLITTDTKNTALTDRQRQKAGRAFTLLELLVVISVIALLMSIILPCLSTAWERAKELNAFPAEINEEGNVYLEIHKLFDRKSYEDIYMILIEPPIECVDCRVSLKRPCPKGMRLVRRKADFWDGYYLKWRPQTDQLGRHKVTVVFKGEETTEQQITIYLYNKELLEKELEDQDDDNDN